MKTTSKTIDSAGQVADDSHEHDPHSHGHHHDHDDHNHDAHDHGTGTKATIFRVPAPPTIVS